MTGLAIWTIGILFTMCLILPDKWDNDIHPLGILGCVFMWPVALGTWLRHNHYKIEN